MFQEDSNFRELSSEDKLNLEIAPVCYFTILLETKKVDVDEQFDFKIIIGTWEMK